MSAFSSIRCQEIAVGVLERALQGRLASAYLFEGPSGVGKERAALALAKEAIGPSAGARIDHGTHPDVRIFRPRDEGHRNIKVEVLREEILRYAEFAPFESDAAFLIFPEADISFPEAHAEGANALLKTLEEPKKGVTFVMLSERPDRLLPTIRSRCQRLRFSRLTTEVVEEILEAEGVEDDEVRATAAALADGRADRALKLATDGAATELFELALRVDKAAQGNRPGALIAAAEELARHDDLLLALDTLCLFYRDVAAAALGMGESALRFRRQASVIRERACIGARRASERVALMQQVLLDLEANGQKQMTMDALLHRMRAA
ncbi:MAG: AAA family ATPase [Myxococcota bacterium]